MITMKEWMELVDYRVTEGSEYGWTCFGKCFETYQLDSWDGKQDGTSFSIVFNTKTQEVYEVSVCDMKNDRAYRMMNPEYVDAYKEEMTRRGVEDEAWEGVDWTDLEVDDDFLEKAIAIANDEDYDTRVQVQLDLEQDLMFNLMKMAHEHDLTLNELVEKMLRSVIDECDEDEQRNIEE